MLKCSARDFARALYKHTPRLAFAKLEAMFAVALLFAMPLSDQQVRFLSWNNSLALPDAPKQVVIEKFTLLDVLRMEEADELLRGRVHFRNSIVCKEFRVFAKKKRGFFYLRKYSNPSIGSQGHTGGTRSGQTCKTPKDLSSHESEERGCGESVGLYVVYMCERGGWGRGG